MALRGKPSDFTSVLHTGLKHKNKQIFCSAQFLQTAWLLILYDYIQIPGTRVPDPAEQPKPAPQPDLWDHLAYIEPII